MHLRIKPVSNLNAVTLTTQGNPRKVTGWSYVAGTVHINVRITVIEFTNKFQVKFEL